VYSNFFDVKKDLHTHTQAAEPFPVKLTRVNSGDEGSLGIVSIFVVQLLNMELTCLLIGWFIKFINNIFHVYFQSSASLRGLRTKIIIESNYWNSNVLLEVTRKVVVCIK